MLPSTSGLSPPAFYRLPRVRIPPGVLHSFSSNWPIGLPWYWLPGANPSTRPATGRSVRVKVLSPHDHPAARPVQQRPADPGKAVGSTAYRMISRSLHHYCHVAQG